MTGSGGADEANEILGLKQMRYAVELIKERWRIMKRLNIQNVVARKYCTLENKNINRAFTSWCLLHIILGKE